MGLLVFYLFLAIGFSFLCSILEAVILSVSPTFVRISVEQEKPGSGLLRNLKENIDRPLSAILTLNTIAHTVGAAGVGAQAVAVFGEVYFGLISAILTFLILVFSEVIPKTLGARYWRRLAFSSARIIRILVYILYPLVVVSEVFTKLLRRGKNSQSVTREEIAVLARLGAQEGVFRESESRLLDNILKFGNVQVRTALTPRTVVVSAQEDLSLEEFFVREEGMKFSRIPLYKKSIEDTSSYVLKDDLLTRLVEVKGSLKLKDISRPAIIIPENYAIHALFEQMLIQKEHIALVVDEYGGFAGIITMEDIIETILGREIQDESDTHSDMQKLAKERWKVRAQRMGLDEPE